jgi:hypothetical protein
MMVPDRLELAVPWREDPKFSCASMMNPALYAGNPV